MDDVIYRTKKRMLILIVFQPRFQDSPLPSTSIGVLVVLVELIKKLSKMVGNKASYPFNSWCVARKTLNNYRILVNCMQTSVFLPKIQ